MQNHENLESDPDLLPEIRALKEKTSSDFFQNIELPSLEKMPPFVREFAEKIKAISGSWNPVEIYTANNREQEKATFLAQFNAGEVYQPQFTYSVAEGMDLNQSAEQLNGLYEDLRSRSVNKRTDRFERLARVMLLAKIQDDLATCELVEGIQQKDEVKIGKALKRKYQGDAKALLPAAEADYERRTQPVDTSETPFIESPTGLLSADELAHLKNTPMNDQQIKSAFEWGLGKLKILQSNDQAETGFQVVIDAQASSIDVRDKSVAGPTVFVPKDRSLTAMDLLVLMVHEIGGHARQSINGERLFGLGGGALKFDDETLYEGLAMRNEREFQTKFCGKDPNDIVSHYVFAVADAEKGESFYTIFENQLKVRLHIELKIAPDETLPKASDIDQTVYEKAQKQAWMTTYRVMRGHTDMTNPKAFAMSKDLAYFRGTLLDEQLVENGLGYMNESAVMTRGGLQALAELKFAPKDLPIKYSDLGTLYWEEVLKPQYEQSLNQ